MLLAGIGEWDQALDTAQRCLDSETDNIDSLQVVAIHAFTQESQPHDAIQKLEDLDRAILSKEPSAITLPAYTAMLFSNICCRHPRALQVRILIMRIPFFLIIPFLLTVLDLCEDD